MVEMRMKIYQSSHPKVMLEWPPGGCLTFTEVLPAATCQGGGATTCLGGCWLGFPVISCCGFLKFELGWLAGLTGSSQARLKLLLPPGAWCTFTEVTPWSCFENSIYIISNRTASTQLTTLTARIETDSCIFMQDERSLFSAFGVDYIVYIMMEGIFNEPPMLVHYLPFSKNIQKLKLVRMTAIQLFSMNLEMQSYLYAKWTLKQGVLA